MYIQSLQSRARLLGLVTYIEPLRPCMQGGVVMPPAAASLLLLALLFLAAQPRTAHATSADHDDEQRPLTAGGGVDDWNNLTAFARVSWGPTAAPLSAVVAGACARAESGAAAAAIDPRHWLVGSDDVGVTPCRVQVRLPKTIVSFPYLPAV